MITLDGRKVFINPDKIVFVEELIGDEGKPIWRIVMEDGMVLHTRDTGLAKIIIQDYF